MSKINKVAVFGMGKSGKAALRLAKKLNLEVYAVNQGDPVDWYQTEKLHQLIGMEFCFAQEAFTERFTEMDEIILSPGIALTHPVLKSALAQKVPVISEIEFAYRQIAQVPVIAITGTNGKTTTTTMIAEALTLAGKRVFCGGNIGVPYCEMVLTEEKFDYAVIEVSSFQLETIQSFHPRIGLILNLFPNHSERYDNAHDYARAKFRLLKNMTADDALILGSENPYLPDISLHPVARHFFSKGNLPPDFIQTFSFQKARVKGEHNEANFYAAYKVLELLGIGDLPHLFQRFIELFSGVAHRLEYVLQSNGLTVYNDAKSTNALATTTAIKAFNDGAPLHLILGGKLRSESDELLPELLPFKQRITTIYTMGEVSQRLYQELQQDFKVIKCEDMKQVLEMVKKEKVEGNLVFSPAFPSFDQFKNYIDRGEKFKAECYRLWR